MDILLIIIAVVISFLTDIFKGGSIWSSLLFCLLFVVGVALGDEEVGVAAHVIKGFGDLPAEGGRGFLDVGDQLGHVSVPPLAEGVVQGLAHCLLEALHHLQHGVAAAGAQVEDFVVLIDAAELVHGEHVAVGWVSRKLPKSVMWM